MFHGLPTMLSNCKTLAHSMGSAAPGTSILFANTSTGICTPRNVAEVRIS